MPNFKILNPCDPLELEECLKYLCEKNNSPCYLRIGKSGEKTFTKNSYEKWKFNKPRIVVKGKNNICLIGTGPIIKLFFQIEERLNKKKIYPTVISYHTLKPDNIKEISKIFKKYKNIITLEDISEVNGLASMFKTYAFDLKLGEIYLHFH